MPWRIRRWLRVQKIPSATGSTPPEYWNSISTCGAKGPLTAYALKPSVPQLTVAASSAHVYGFPGSSPSVSASGIQNGIVWTLDNSQYCTSNAPAAGRRCSTRMMPQRRNPDLDSAEVAGDAAGNASSSRATIANAVYVGRAATIRGVYGSSTISGELDVYGLRLPESRARPDDRRQVPALPLMHHRVGELQASA